MLLAANVTLTLFIFEIEYLIHKMKYTTLNHSHCHLQITLKLFKKKIYCQNRQGRQNLRVKEDIFEVKKKQVNRGYGSNTRIYNIEIIISYNYYNLVYILDSKYRHVFTYPYFNEVQSRVIEDALYSGTILVIIFLYT